MGISMAKIQKLSSSYWQIQEETFEVACQYVIYRWEVGVGFFSFGFGWYLVPLFVFNVCLD